MDDLNRSKEELINEINMLEIENDSLRQELNLYKENNKIKEKYEVDCTQIGGILDAIPSAVVIIDAKERKFSYMNNRALDLLGINYVGSDLDEHFSKVKALKLDGTPFPLEEIPVRYSLKYGKEVRNKKIIFERADGKQIPVLASSLPIFDAKGTVTSVIAIFEDVTEFRSLEKSLIDSEKMMKIIMENSPVGISIFNLKTGKFKYINPSLVSLIGFTKEEICNISSEEIYERVHPDDRESYIKQINLASSGFNIYEDIEYRWKVKNGEYRWFSIIRYFNQYIHGQPVSLVGISRDITNRKEYEEKLALQANILSNIKEAIIVSDENDTIIYCNKAFVRLFVWQEHELIGRNFYDLVKIFVNKETIEKIAGTAWEGHSAFIIRDENHLSEIKCHSKDGTQLIIDAKRTVVRDSKGRHKGIILSIRDVSERYKYELKLKKSEEKFRYLFNSIDEGLAIEDVIFDIENKPVDFRFIELNPAYEKQTGIIIKDVLGKSAKELGFDLEDFWYEACGKVALKGESTRFVNEAKALNMWLDVYVFKIDLEKNNRVGILFRDIKEKVMHNQKLEELIKIQDELYVNVSHELKTPLNVIFSANQVMDMYLKSDSIVDKKDILFNYNNIIKQNCYRLTKLINNIVDLSKSNSGLLKLNLCNVNIVDVIENIVQSVSEYVKSKELKMIFDTNVEEKIIACDTDMIERVMLNLISNAMKFSYPKGEIFVNVLDKDGIVEISVKDTGRGIEKQNLDYIFNRFYQEDKSLSRNAEGTGLGLSLIKSLVELHNGNISVESEINKGSIFKVELPARTIECEVLREQPNSLNSKIETIKIEFSDIYSIN